ncbi:MAG TPA: TonB-dependent receptor [Luteimonas sp.]|nr:TonB-dependent receptor [Luteimonas sp.]
MSKSNMRRVVRRTALSLALSVCFMPGVQAQSNATGTIFGSGQPGATVVVESLDTGVTRQISVDSSGRYRATALPIGRYKVTLQRDGQALATQEDVSVLLGTGSEVSFGSDNAVQTLGSVQVTASRMPLIDVSATDTRTVFTAEQLANIPVARNITAVALLTPGVVASDSRYDGRTSNAVSFGGSAASENAIYINGYAVTNPLTNLGSTTLPFDGISQFQSITGGYGAEFGRATGGVINILTKRGTNDFHFGTQASWAPKGLRATQKSIYYPNNGTSSDGQLYQNLREREVNEVTYGVYASGPIVKDRLFFYASGETTDRSIQTVGVRNAIADVNFRDLTFQIPRYLAKVDWNITDNHLLEFTAIGDKSIDDERYFRYDYADLTHGQTQNGGWHYEDGGNLHIGKYTGYFGENVTLTALYGKQDQVHLAIPFAYDPSQVNVQRSNEFPFDLPNLQNYPSLPRPDAADHTKGGRLDLEWRLGDHTLRAGYDRQDSTSTAGQATSGPGYRWLYDITGTPNEPIASSGGARGPGGDGTYVIKTNFTNGGTFNVQQAAQYIEDRWQISDRWLLSLGLRNEQFTNYNADHLVYASQRHQLAPRIGASWDVNGDSSLKVFGNVGRYHLAMPNNVALRGAAASLFTSEYFAYTGIDPVTGVPTGLTPLGDGPYSANNEYGQAKDPRSVAATDLRSHYQDEAVFGFEKLLASNMTFGARFVYRNLRSAIDDMCDPRAAIAWGLRNGYDQATSDALGFSLQQCRLFNPGEANTFLLDDGTGNLITVPLTADELGFPKLKRKYLGLDMFLERPFDGTWYGKIDYTLSKNYGNAEGQLNSDVGQQDVSQTLIWDHPELMQYSNGYLPNDRRHYVKAFGFYQVTPEWRFSGTLVAASGRPKNCFGFLVGGSQDFYDNIDYGPYYHYCNGEPAPRGTAGRLPPLLRLDLGVAYAPAFLDHNLKLAVDVFNVFNRQSVQNVYELHDTGSAEHPGTLKRFGQPISYSDPRSIRFLLRYDY